MKDVLITSVSGTEMELLFSRPSLLFFHIAVVAHPVFVIFSLLYYGLVR